VPQVMHERCARHVADLQVCNLSGETPVVRSTIRHNERGTDGRWVPPGSTLVRPLDQPAEMVRDVVTGQMVRGRDQSMLIRNDPLDGNYAHAFRPDFSGQSVQASMDYGVSPRRTV
jgi:hypothetical protein